MLVLIEIGAISRAPAPHPAGSRRRGGFRRRRTATAPRTGGEGVKLLDDEVVAGGDEFRRGRKPVSLRFSITPTCQSVFPPRRYAFESPRYTARNDQRSPDNH